MGFRKNNRKYFAPVAAHQISGAHFTQENIRESFENLIAGFTAMFIVDGLEMIDLGHHQADRYTAALGTIHFRLQRIFEVA